MRNILMASGNQDKGFQVCIKLSLAWSTFSTFQFFLIPSFFPFPFPFPSYYLLFHFPFPFPLPFHFFYLLPCLPFPFFHSLPCYLPLFLLPFPFRGGGGRQLYTLSEGLRKTVQDHITTANKPQSMYPGICKLYCITSKRERITKTYNNNISWFQFMRQTQNLGCIYRMNK